MKISIYTKIKNGLHFDYHIEAMLRHHAPLVDEIIVNEGYSTDGTFEAIEGIDPKIRIIRSHWDFVMKGTNRASAKNLAREQCTGDWCVLLDSDEFIPEWEFEKLRRLLEATEEDILPVQFIHFYGNYKVCANLDRALPVPPPYGYRIHRNIESISAWGDGSNVHFRDTKPPPPPQSGVIEVHHFGEVRHPARLREKWNMQARRHNQGKSWLRIPSVLFSIFPHRWINPEVVPQLSIYEGRIMKTVQNNPDEFVRDNWKTLSYLKDQAVQIQSSGNHD